MSEQSFFARLYKAIEGTTWTMNITAIKGTLTISMIPSIGSNLPALNMSGTPEDFENEFFTQLENPLQTISFQVQGYSELAEALKKSQDELSKKLKDASKKPSGASGSTNTEQTSKATTKKDEKPAPTVDIFSDEPEEPVEEPEEEGEEASEEPEDGPEETPPAPPEEPAIKPEKEIKVKKEPEVKPAPEVKDPEPVVEEKPVEPSIDLFADI